MPQGRGKQPGGTAKGRRKPRAPSSPNGVPVKTLIEEIAGTFLTLDLQKERIQMERDMNGHKGSDRRVPGPQNPNPKTYDEDEGEINAMKDRLAERYRTYMPLVRKRIKEIKEEQEAAG